jgi:CheY-like chemotaxis protein
MGCLQSSSQSNVINNQTDTHNKFIKYDVIDKHGVKQPMKVKHVLIVDDVEINCDIIEEYIHSYSFNPKITKVYQGKDAIAAIEENPDISLALVDIKMIPMDGYELANKMRNEYKYDKLIIGITGMVDVLSVKKAINNGMNEVCAKPLDFEDFLKTLDKYGYKLKEIDQEE